MSAGFSKDTPNLQRTFEEVHVLPPLEHDAVNWEPVEDREFEEPSEKHLELHHTPGGSLEQEVHTQLDRDARQRIEERSYIALLAQHKTRRSTGRPKVIPLVPKMLRLLKWLKKHSTSTHCFVNSRGEPWTVNAIDQRVQNIRERAGFDSKVIPYTLRHRAATNAILKTGNLKMTSQLLGHSSTQTTERYTHVAQQHLVTFACQAVG